MVLFGHLRLLRQFPALQRCPCRCLKSGQQIPRTRPGIRLPFFYEGRIYLLIAPIITSGLCVWQIRRKKWKTNLKNELRTLLEADPIPLPENLSDLENLELHAVKVRGHFEYDKEVYLGPKSDTPEEPTPLEIPGQRVSGVHVITPFKVADRDLKILVNRGWYSTKKLKDDGERLKGQTPGEREIVGIVRHSQKGRGKMWNYFFNKGKPSKIKDCDVFLSRNVDVMSNYCGTDPVFLDGKMVRTSPTEPKPIVLGSELSDNHLEYAFTWGLLTVVLIFMWIKTYRSAPNLSSMHSVIDREEARRAGLAAKRAQSIRSDA